MLLLLLDLVDVVLLLDLTDLSIESFSALASGTRLVSSPRRAAFAPVAATSKIEIAAETFMMICILLLMGCTECGVWRLIG